MNFCRFLRRLDFFGKEIEFYVDGKQKQVTFIGRIFTCIYIILYILIFSYKLYRMAARVDVTFYDSYSNTNEVPTVKINQDNFTLVFGLNNNNGAPFVDDSIYYPKAYFYDNGNYDEIEIELCDKNKLSKEITEYFGTNIDKYFCLSNTNFELKPFKNSLRLEIYPCIDLYEGEDFCESREFLDNYLNNLLFMIYIEDINLTPLNYNNPVKKKISFFNTEIFRNLGQYLYTELQLVKVETLTNIIGFDFFTEPKIEEFIKYDKEIILTYPGYNVLDENNSYPATIFEIQLNDRILLEKREYVNLIEVLGDIGGFFEIINSLFLLICSVFVEIIYKKGITNNLFSFDIKKKLILIKNPKNSLNKISEDNKLRDINIHNLDINTFNNIKNKNKEKKLIIKSNFKNINNNINKDDFAQKSNASEIKSSIKEIKLENIDFQSIKKNYEEDINKNSLDDLNNFTKKDKTEQSNDNDWIIDKIYLRNLLILKFCCVKKYKGRVYDIILKESMKLIKEKLDIFSIFRSIYKIENSNNVINENLDSIKMSGEFTKVLSDIIKS